MNKKIHVVAHTHWDYEWYFTNNESFIQLCYHVDEVIEALEKGYLDYYMLDGQMSIVEDYLQANPDKRDRFVALVSSGKLKIGPWYTQSDQMIIRGESLVRNLQIGMEMGDMLGGADRLGYIPDAFGQSVDMPKIFSSMGIDRAVFWRGLASDTTTQREFFWESEDGSRVMAYNIKDGYFVGVQLIETDHYDALMEQVAKDSVSSHIALPVGGDQRYVDFNLKERIESYNQHVTDAELIESSYDNLFQGIQDDTIDMPTIQGEQLNAEVSKIHRSIYSSRYDHKYLNDEIERRLIYQVEPLMAIADQIGIPYKKTLLDDIWKTTLRNHAHDSAGGCNSDKTNRHILHRLIEADEQSFSLVDYLTRKISESRSNVEKNQMTLFNTLPFRVKKVITLNVSLVNTTFAIYHNGKKIPYQLLKTTKQSNDPIRREMKPDSSSYYYEMTVVLPVELAPLGYDVLDIVEGEEGQVDSELHNQAQQQSTSIENNFYKITFDDGKINVLDKRTNDLYEDFLQLEDSGDDGDNYDYSPPYEDQLYKLDMKDAEVVIEHGKIESKLTLTGAVNVPHDLKARQTNQCHSKIPYTWTLSLRKDVAFLYTNLEIGNTALDHRMRLNVNGKVKTEESIADTPFGTISRPAVDRHLASWKQNGWKEEPTGLFPMLSFVNLHDKKRSVTAFAKGIKEYEVTGEDEKSLTLTLFRSVGYLGKPDLLRRPGVASGNQFRYIETPDSQLQKHMRFSMAFAIGEHFNEAEAFYDYQKYAVSVPYYQQQNLNQFTTPLKYFVMHPLAHQVPEAFSLLDASAMQGIVLSTVKMGRDGKGLIARFFNPSEYEITNSGEVIGKQPISAWNFVTIDESLISEAIHDTDVIALGTFKPKEIKTVSIQFK